MAWKNEAHRWGRLAQFLHWLMALLIILVGTIGLVMTDMANSPDKVRVYALHKSVGLTILALVLLRLTWRAYDTRPLSPSSQPRWETWAAHAAHALLYALMLAIPLSGWLFNSAANFPLQWFGLIHLPSLTGGANPELKAFARAAHFTLFWVLVGTVILHAGAALKHHFFDRDTVLTQMLPWKTKNNY